MTFFFISDLGNTPLKVDSIDKARANLETKGVKFTEPIKPADGGSSAVFSATLKVIYCIWCSPRPKWFWTKGKA
jgi:hypothetical protein